MLMDNVKKFFWVNLLFVVWEMDLFFFMFILVEKVVFFILGIKDLVGVCLILVSILLVFK